MLLKKYRLVVILSLLLIILFKPISAQNNDCKPFNFNLSPNFKAASNVFSFISTDLNNDGYDDVVTPNYDRMTVGILYGDGEGGFAPPKNFPTGININVAAVGDLNGDGKTDLVGGHSGSNQIAVLLNNGQGDFPTPTVLTLPSNIREFYDLKVADFNGDGNADVAGVTRENLNFFLGNGKGGLVLNTTLQWSGYKSRLAVGNFNNDNLPDLAVTSGENYPWEVGIVLGRQGGGFTVGKRFSLNEQPTGIVTGEFNGDGLTDFVISANYPYANSTPKTYYLQPWLGNGSGDFSGGTKVQLPFLNSDVAVGDFNGDGKQDLAANLGSIVAVVDGVGDGTFKNQTYWTTPSAIAIASTHANRDGKKDLLILQPGFPDSFISVLLSLGDSGFAAPKAVVGGGTDLAAADLNNDGFKDFISAEDTLYVTTSEILTALNDKAGGLQPDSSFEAPDALTAVKTGDFNADGNKDVVTAHSANPKRIAVFLGNGAGDLGTPISTTFTAGIKNIAVADFNADGKDDVFAVDENGRAFSLLSSGNGTFTSVSNTGIDLPGYFIDIEKGDFNQDGKPDLVISNHSVINLLLGDGAGRFSQSDSQSVNTDDIAVGDLNGDGDLDIAGIRSPSETIITRFFGNGNGKLGSSSTQTVTGRSSSVISADFNSDGFDDLAFINSGSRGSLVVVPSSGQTPFWQSPIFYLVGGLGGASGGFSSSIIAADYNGDNRIDIGLTSRYRSRAVIYNTSGQKPCISAGDVTVTEGDTGSVTATFIVKLSAPSVQSVRVSYSLEGRSATLGTDFQNTAGRLLIAAGKTDGIVQVVVNGDLLNEFDESFVLHLTSPDNAVLLKADAIGTITDNDAEPTLTVGDSTLAEGYSQAASFRVALSAPSGKPVSFRYATSDGTAIAGKDYYAAANTWTIVPGQTSVNVSITIAGDNIYERDENFFLTITEPINVTVADGQAVATITNDDPVPTLNFYSGQRIEGDTGIMPTTITLQLSNPTYLPVILNVLTSDGTATGGKDYVAADFVVTIAPEQQTATAAVQIIGDTINEPNETFNINVYNIANATIGVAQAQVFIIDDEAVGNDFDRDGKTDLAVFRPGGGFWYVLNSSTNNFTGSQYGVSTDVPASGDYNGDGRTDITVWRPTNGTWYSTIANRTQQWGTNGDVPVAGDYDNDGKTDVGVFRPNTQTWYIQLSSTGAFKFVQWGLEADTPVPADYDGDGKTDIAVYRPSNGFWYILRSTDNGFSAVQFGISTDKTVPGDYDGDGKTDIAVFRDGIWYVNRSSDNGVTGFQWGMKGDKTVPGNYDGDSKTDFAVYRDGVWWIWQSSTNNYVSKQFGLPDDIPIPFVSGN